MNSWSGHLYRLFSPPTSVVQATEGRDDFGTSRVDRHEGHDLKRKAIFIDLTGSDDEDATVKDTSRPEHDELVKQSACVGSQNQMKELCARDNFGRTTKWPAPLSMPNLAANDRESTRHIGNPPNMVFNTKRKTPEEREPEYDKRVKIRRISEGCPMFQSNGLNERHGLKQSRVSSLEATSLKLTINTPTKARHDSSPFLPSGQAYLHKATRVSSDSQVKKLSKSAIRSREKLTGILEKHVFIHVRLALRSFRDRLSRDDRAKIGADAVRLVIEHPNFEKHFKENGSTILPGFESLIATQMRSYINGCARHILGNEAVDQILHCTELDNKYLTPPQKIIPVNPRCSSNSDLASEYDDIFCQQQEPLGRSNSLSPSTSLSIDPMEIEAEKTQNDCTETKNGPTRRPTRSTRAANPVYTKPSRKKSIPHRVSIISGRVENSLACEEVHPRPYMRFQDRDALALRNQETNPKFCNSNIKNWSHVSFSEVELRHLVLVVESSTGNLSFSKSNSLEKLTDLMDGRAALIPKIVDSIDYGTYDFATVRALSGRSRPDIEAFLIDAANDTISEPKVLPTQNFYSEAHESQKKINSINRMLRHREIDGIFPERICRGFTSYREIVHSSLEDSLVSRIKWADCSNDIATITWTSDKVFLIGALTHSDPHNMQYNRPGNLLLGSVLQETVRSYPDHRIERPIISQSQNAENAQESMRATQSPWLYTSVVSTAFSSISGYSFTSSYDNTTKVWKVSEDGSSMDLCATWKHEAKVNFVITSDHHERVATASATGKNAVRVYHFNKDAISDSPYDEYGGNQSQDPQRNLADPEPQRPWAYQPATIKWARAACVANLFLVGYSPRADSGDDSDIPEDKTNTGELCVWNSEDASQVNISSARMQNVFDVVWHPTQPVFAAATSPTGNYDGDKTKTQVRIFALKESTFIRIMALDCPALDITELTIMPNSPIKAYVTASCTDGCTYVWDMAQGEDPIHILRHGESLDNPEPNLPLELADGGVTFSAWGADVSRFYTGATDGKLIAWDVRKSPGHAFVRKVLELSGGISSGAFNKDFKRLIIGDSTGKIHLLEIDNGELDEDENLKTRHSRTKDMIAKPRLPILAARPPKLIIPHQEPGPSETYENRESKKPFEHTPKYFLDQGILQMYPGIGVFKGPNYHQLGLYHAEAHESKNVQKPLIPKVMAVQQFLKRKSVRQNQIIKFPRLQNNLVALDQQLHAKNLKKEFNFSKLHSDTKKELKKDSVELNWDGANFFHYELTPRSNIFRIGRERRSTARSKVEDHKITEL